VDFSHAPAPSNDSEQLLFPQHFETLVRLDCRGNPRPGLAKWWSTDETGRIWTFVLPDAHRVVSSWRERETMIRALGIESAVVGDSSLLVVTLSQTPDAAPGIFANPRLAIPTGRSRLAADTGIYVVQSAGRSPVIQFRIEPGGDPRDALDRGADLAVTRDPALVDYVAGRAEFVTFPLPWSRTYVMLQPAVAEPLDIVREDAQRRSLARDAVSVDARAADPPFWFNEPASCSTVTASGPTATSSRIVYIAGDGVARELAERIVALAGSGTGLRAAALEPPELATALRAGTERAYVVALPRTALAPCATSADWPHGARIQPLIDTRAHAIVRKGAPLLTVDWDGTVRVAPR
jgi:hypothetical protein